MKRLNFRIIHQKVSEEEKKQRIKTFNEFTGSNITYEQLKDEPMYDDFIDMTCLKCKHSKIVEADIILECFDKHTQPYPIEYCPCCNEESFVPTDVYTQLNNLPFKNME